MQKIGDSLRTNETIYGTISRDGQKILITLTNIEKDSKTQMFSKKSMVVLSFYENQLEYYAKEAAKKLVNPGYRIKRTDIITFGAKVFIAELKVKRVKGLDISLLEFTSPDRVIEVILGDLKRIVNKGDILYKDGNYYDARAEYENALGKIEDKLPPRKRKKLKSFTTKVKGRITDSYYTENIAQIEEIDNRLKGKEIEDILLLNKAINEYTNINTVIDNIPREYAKKSKSLKAAITTRKDNTYLAVISYHEREGDLLYNEHKFDKAIRLYQKAKLKTKNITPQKKRSKSSNRIDKKIRTAVKTGKSYLASKVNYLLDMAAIENFRDNATNARRLMAKAKDHLEENTQFLTDELSNNYNETAMTIEADRFKTPEEIEEEIAREMGKSGERKK